MRNSIKIGGHKGGQVCRMGESMEKWDLNKEIALAFGKPVPAAALLREKPPRKL